MPLIGKVLVAENSYRAGTLRYELSWTGRTTRGLIFTNGTLMKQGVGVVLNTHNLRHAMAVGDCYTFAEHDPKGVHCLKIKI